MIGLLQCTAEGVAISETSQNDQEEQSRVKILRSSLQDGAVRLGTWPRQDSSGPCWHAKRCYAYLGQRLLVEGPVTCCSL